jgi:ubiquinone/menaquinone biosynthesis C-methylase UbiE
LLSKPFPAKITLNRPSESDNFQEKMSLQKLKNYILLHSFVNRPFFFNNLRYLVTGNQKSLKDFVGETLKKYHCQSVLDVCCGTGDFAQKEAKKYLGIDINPQFISFAKKKYQNKKIKFVYGDALALPLRNEKFDATLLVSTLHHFSDNETKRILEQVKRVTRKIVIVIDLIPYPSNFLKRFLVVLDQGGFVRREKEKEKLVSQFYKIKSTRKLSAGLAEQYGIIAEIK